jgi:hypothetical protein
MSTTMPKNVQYGNKLDKIIQVYQSRWMFSALVVAKIHVGSRPLCEHHLGRLTHLRMDVTATIALPATSC